VKTVNVWYDNFKPFSSGGLALPAIYFTSIYRITHITFYTQFKRLWLSIMHCSLYTISSFALERLQPRWRLVLRSLPPLMHFTNRCTWKSSRYCIIMIMMTSFMRVSQKLGFPQSKYISAIKCILYPRLSSCICGIPCYCDAYWKFSALRVGVKTLHNTIPTRSQLFMWWYFIWTLVFPTCTCVW